MRLIPENLWPRRAPVPPGSTLTRREVRRLQQCLEHDRDAALSLALERRTLGRSAPKQGVIVEARDIGPARMGKIVQGRLRDVSEEGLSLALPVDIAASTRLHLTLHRVGEQAIELLCTARWSHALQDGFAVGCDAGVDWSASLCDLVTCDNPRPRLIA
ncbi:MAG: PilZ domain-containing protein [Planctomycetota bacterium]